VQKVCRRARGEDEVRETLDIVWKQPEKAEEFLDELRMRNEDYRFEEMLEAPEKPI
jgi:hypothetical protein